MTKFRFPDFGVDENCFPTPTGLCPKAQGWRFGLPWVNEPQAFQPQRGCGGCLPMEPRLGFKDNRIFVWCWCMTKFRFPDFRVNDKCFPTPTGLCPKAQGWRFGLPWVNEPQTPTGLWRVFAN